MRGFVIDYVWFVRHSLDKENTLTNKAPRMKVWFWSLYHGFSFANDIRKGV